MTIIPLENVIVLGVFFSEFCSVLCLTLLQIKQ